MVAVCYVDSSMRQTFPEFLMNVVDVTISDYKCHKGWCPGGGGGGGGYSPQILVGMCHGKVNKWQGPRNELPIERENGGLRNELEPI